MAVKRQTLNIPEQALQVLKMLERAGNKPYFVGQCVAELLRGGSPMDYDIITTADFSEMLYVFRDMRIVSQNEDMSSVMVSSLGLVIQVSSYCGEIKDGKAVYTDNYKSGRCIFCGASETQYDREAERLWSMLPYGEAERLWSMWP